MTTRGVTGPGRTMAAGMRGPLAVARLGPVPKSMSIVSGSVLVRALVVWEVPDMVGGDKRRHRG